MKEDIPTLGTKEISDSIIAVKGMKVNNDYRIEMCEIKDKKVQLMVKPRNAEIELALIKQIEEDPFHTLTVKY